MRIPDLLRDRSCTLTLTSTQVLSVPVATVIAVLARYRYRIEPTEVQRGMLARTFGCCRVAFNDAIRCRQDSHQAGKKVTPSKVQRRVVTEAKNTEVRAWLSEVAMGSSNRVKSRRKVAVQHGKVARARRDCHQSRPSR
jgi:hypothetical protein